MLRIQQNKLWLLSLYIVLVTGVADTLAVRVNEQAMAKLADSQQVHSNPLMTYYFHVSEPEIALTTGRASGRVGRTGLTLKLTERTVSKFSPVVLPKGAASGMVHSVSNTWKTLKVSISMQCHLVSCCSSSLCLWLVGHASTNRRICSCDGCACCKHQPTYSCPIQEGRGLPAH